MKKSGLSSDLDVWCKYLRSKGITQTMINEIRFAFASDALAQSHNLKADRVYTVFCLAMLEDDLEPERILKISQNADRLFGRIRRDETDWQTEMNRLRDDGGIVIHTGDDDRILIDIEYKEDSEQC